MIKEADKHGSGVIDYADFRDLMKRLLYCELDVIVSFLRGMQYPREQRLADSKRLAISNIARDLLSPDRDLLSEQRLAISKRLADSKD